MRIAPCVSSVFSLFPATLVKRELLTPLGNTFLGPGGGNQKWAKMEARNGSEMLGVHLGGAAHTWARVCMVHMCVCVHTRVPGRGSQQQESWCRCHLALPATAWPRSRFQPTFETTLAKINLNEVFSSMQHGRHPGLWFSKVTAEGKEKKKITR